MQLRLDSSCVRNGSQMEKCLDARLTTAFPKNDSLAWFMVFQSTIVKSGLNACVAFAYSLGMNVLFLYPLPYNDSIKRNVLSHYTWKV